MQSLCRRRHPFFSSTLIQIGLIGAEHEFSGDIQHSLHRAAALTVTMKSASPADWVEILSLIIRKVHVEVDSLRLLIDRQALLEKLGCKSITEDRPGDFEYQVPARITIRSGQMKIIVRATDESTAGADQKLIKAVARAHAWFEQLQTGAAGSIREIAEQENLSASYVMRYIKLAFLAPNLVDAILAGRQPPGVSVRSLTNGKQLPSDWAEQRQLLNFPAH